jgi:hypothetical protein
MNAATNRVNDGEQVVSAGVGRALGSRDRWRYCHSYTARNQRASDQAFRLMRTWPRSVVSLVHGPVS